MVEEEKFVFLTYDHDKQLFELSSQPEKLMELLEQQEHGVLEEELANLGIDGLLVLDAEHEKWYLVFSKNTGIVVQRTARRHADTIVRSGFPHPKGYRIKGEYPLEELSSYNIGDLWQSVQNKYLKSDLKGTDNVTIASNPEIVGKTTKNKTKIKTKTKTKTKASTLPEPEPLKQATKKTTKSKTTKAKTLPEPEKIPVTRTKKTGTAQKAKVTKSPTTETRTQKPVKTDINQFVMEIKDVITFVEQGNTQLLVKGEPEQEEYPKVLLVKQENIPKQRFYKALLLQKGDLIQVNGKREGDLFIVNNLDTESIL